MTPYLAILKRDLYKDPWLIVILVVLIFLKMLDVNIDLVFVLCVSLYSMRLLNNRIKDFRTLLPCEAIFNFKYAVSMVVLSILLFCSIRSNSLIDSGIKFNAYILIINSITLISLYSSSKLLESIINILLMISVVYVLGYFDEIIDQYYFDLSLSTVLTLLLCFSALFLNIIMYLNIYKTITTRRNLYKYKKTTDIPKPVNENVIHRVTGKYKSYEVTKYLFSTCERIIKNGTKVFIFDKTLNDSLYPKESTNPLNNLALLGVFVYLILASGIFNEDLIFLSFLFIIANYLFSVDFISKRKLMIYVWLRLKSRNRSSFMGRVVLLLINRHACLLLCCTLTFLLLGLAFKNSIILSQEYIILVINYYFSWLLQLSLILYLTPKIKLNDLWNMGIFVASFFTFYLFQLASNTATGMIIIYLITIFLLIWNILQWRITRLE